MSPKGYVFKSHGSWFVRHPDGAGKQHAHRLASTQEYPKKNEVQPLADEYMASVNQTKTVAAAGTVAGFFQNVFLPAAKLRISKLSVRNYKTYWRKLAPHLGSMRLRDVRVVDVQRALNGVHKSDGENISHGQYRLCKVTMSAIFSEALRLGHVVSNPATGASVRGFGHTKHNPNEVYSLSEVKAFLAALNGQAAIGVGLLAFLGLRGPELEAVRPEDYDGQTIRIHRATKTHDDTRLPVIGPLRKLLEFWTEPVKAKDVRDAMRATGLPWRGLYGFRRGLATTLYTLGIGPDVACLLLRNDRATCAKHYLRLDAEQQRGSAMAHSDMKPACGRRRVWPT